MLSFKVKKNVAFQGEPEDYKMRFTSHEFTWCGKKILQRSWLTTKCKTLKSWKRYCTFWNVEQTLRTC